jgi:hypothetical protein
VMTKKTNDFPKIKQLQKKKVRKNTHTYQTQIQIQKRNI